MVTLLQSTDIPGFTVPEVFSYVENLGFDGVDYLTSIRNFYIRPKHILKLSKRHNLPIISIHQPKLLVPVHPRIFFKRMRVVINFFPDLKLSNYHLSGFINILHRNPKLVKHFLQVTKNHNTTVTFESNPRVLSSLYPKVTYMPEKFAEFCVKNQLPITFDTSHISDNGFDIVKFFRKYNKNIHLIHLSDFHKGKEHLPLGMGSLPIRELLIEIKKTSWKKIIIFEIKRYPGSRNKLDKISMLKKSVDMVRKYT